jgi:hypothetical protein
MTHPSRLSPVSMTLRLGLWLTVRYSAVGVNSTPKRSRELLSIRYIAKCPNFSRFRHETRGNYIVKVIKTAPKRCGETLCVSRRDRLVRRPGVRKGLKPPHQTRRRAVGLDPVGRDTISSVSSRPVFTIYKVKCQTVKYPEISADSTTKKRGN